jgi:hypothetical protein
MSDQLAATAAWAAVMPGIDLARDPERQDGRGRPLHARLQGATGPQAEPRRGGVHPAVSCLRAERRATGNGGHVNLRSPFILNIELTANLQATSR